MKLNVVILVCCASVVAGFLVLWRLGDHDLARWRAERFDVTISGETVSGTIWVPDDTAPSAVVAFVHGDGPQDRSAAGGYAPMINVFLERGIAVASWDKPGVGASDGNWLLQSMQDRTTEAATVLGLLQARFPDLPRGALGFSQAGWVLPGLTPADADFLILIGGAVSWQDQGAYYTRVRLEREGLDARAIAEALRGQQIQDERAFGVGAGTGDIPEGLSRDRWHFIRHNRDADASPALASLELPILAIWGAEDLNVDPARNAATYRTALADRAAPTQIIEWPNATHSLLKAPTYNWQLTEDWSSWAVVRFLAEGRYAYAPGVLDTIASWILERSDFRPGQS